MPSPPRGRFRSEARRLREALREATSEKDPVRVGSPSGGETQHQAHSREAQGSWTPKRGVPHVEQATGLESQGLPPLFPILGPPNLDQVAQEPWWPPRSLEKHLDRHLGALEEEEEDRDAGVATFGASEGSLERRTPLEREELATTRVPGVDRYGISALPTTFPSRSRDLLGLDLGVYHLSLELSSKTLADFSKNPGLASLAPHGHPLASPSPFPSIHWREFLEEDVMASEKWTFSGEEGGLSFRKFKMRFKSERNAV